jgi:hypothetical protein
MKITAKRDVSKAITRDHRGHFEPWPSTVPKVSITIIQIFYALIDGVGDRLEMHTWSVGSTARVALRKWLNTRPAPTAEDFHYTVLAGPKPARPTNYNPMGKRVETTDTLAEYLAATEP